MICRQANTRHSRQGSAGWGPCPCSCLSSPGDTAGRNAAHNGHTATSSTEPLKRNPKTEELLGDTSKTTTLQRRCCRVHCSAQSRMLLALLRIICSSSQEPHIPGTLPGVPLGTPCPIPAGKHHPGWHTAVPGTARAHPGGWQQSSKTRHGRRAAKGGLFTLRSSSNSSQAAVRDSLAPGGKGGHPALSHPGLHLLTGHILSEGSPGTIWGPNRWQSPQCTRPAPRETAQLISSPLSLPVPSGLAGGSGSNRSEETAGSHVAASHQGLQNCQGCPRLPMPPSSSWTPTAKGPLAPSKALSLQLAGMWLVLAQPCEVEGCSDLSSRGAVDEQRGKCERFASKIFGAERRKGMRQTQGTAPS